MIVAVACLGPTNPLENNKLSWRETVRASFLLTRLMRSVAWLQRSSEVAF